MYGEYHIPVMVSEVLALLDAHRGGLYLDCTLGGGGHANAVLERGGTVIAMDRDPDAVAWSAARLAPYGPRFTASISRFSRIREVAGERAGRFDGVLMDLGLSSKMIDDPARGFSYRHDGPLLMDMGGAERTARDAVNMMDARELAAVFRTYGEERHAARIAAAIIRARAIRPVETTGGLSSVIESAVGPSLPQKSKARIFQALRIYVNNEIGELREGLEGALEVLRPGGRLCVISYHSLEDREVKTFMRDRANPCTCPPDFPECRCGRSPELRILTKRPARPSEREVAGNERARSALLRAAEKAAGA
jgi:16S rRNA (cytosine1402-N4)-methyltransferase